MIRLTYVFDKDCNFVFSDIESEMVVYKTQPYAGGWSYEHHINVWHRISVNGYFNEGIPLNEVPETCKLNLLLLGVM